MVLLYSLFIGFSQEKFRFIFVFYFHPCYAYCMDKIEETVKNSAPKFGAHPTHCCERHGCKYGNDDCPVENKVVSQVYPCEDCSSVEEIEEEISELKEELDWLRELESRGVRV